MSPDHVQLPDLEAHVPWTYRPTWPSATHDTAGCTSRDSRRQHVGAAMPRDHDHGDTPGSHRDGHDSLDFAGIGFVLPSRGRRAAHERLDSRGGPQRPAVAPRQPAALALDHVR